MKAASTLFRRRLQRSSRPLSWSSRGGRRGFVTSSGCWRWGVRRRCCKRVSDRSRLPRYGKLRVGFRSPNCTCVSPSLLFPRWRLSKRFDLDFLGIHKRNKKETLDRRQGFFPRNVARYLRSRLVKTEPQGYFPLGRSWTSPRGLWRNSRSARGVSCRGVRKRIPGATRNGQLPVLPRALFEYLGHHGMCWGDRLSRTETD